MSIKKIYIIGSVASGKTTLAKELSQKLGIPHYELDNLVYKDKNVKRDSDEILSMFEKIIKKDKWIIEDVGRKRFSKGLDKADIIYFIRLPKIKVYYRIIRRWYMQRKGLEEYNFYPCFKDLLDMFKWAHKDNKRYKQMNLPNSKTIVIKNNRILENIKREIK